MLGDENEAVRRIVENKIQSIKGKLAHFEIDSRGFVGGFRAIGDEGNLDENIGEVGTGNVRKFFVPKLNLKTKSYSKLVNLNFSCKHWSSTSH